MYLQKVISSKPLCKNLVFCWRLEGQWRKQQDPDPDPLVRGMDPRVRIHTKMSWIRNTGLHFSAPLVGWVIAQAQVIKAGFRIQIRIRMNRSGLAWIQIQIRFISGDWWSGSALFLKAWSRSTWEWKAGSDSGFGSGAGVKKNFRSYRGSK